MTKICWPDSVFWDFDGTIADSYGFLLNAHNHTLSTLGFEPFKNDEYRAYFGKPRDVIYPAIYKDKTNQAMDIFQSFVFGHSHEIELIDHVGEVLDLFKNKKTPMGIVSNKKASFITEELRHTAYKDYFEVIIGAGDTKLSKPSGDPLDLAVTTMSQQNKNIWYIGDTENDLACAKDFGCPCLFIKGHPDTEQLIKVYQPLFSFDDYRELKEFLVAI